jgi:hypothetical protein
VLACLLLLPTAAAANEHLHSSVLVLLLQQPQLQPAVSNRPMVVKE